MVDLTGDSFRSDGRFREARNSAMTIVAGPSADGDRQGTGFYRHVLKRVLDLLAVAMVALPVLLVLLPLMALVALDGHSPLFFQKRLGRGGRVFRIVKLRTMVPDAEAVLQATLARDPEARAEWDHHQKLRRDPRVTRVGALLRKTSLDELPQLFNVVAGDMSLVGPRPMMPEQRALYPGHEYFAMRPGLTGFWQVSARHETGFAERAAFDGRYHEEMSLLTDIKVMWRTLHVVARGTGC
mgnify:CR=1 FL=1